VDIAVVLRPHLGTLGSVGWAPVTFADCEDATLYVQRLFGLSLVRWIDPVALAGLLRAELCLDAPPGCRGVSLLETPLRVHYAGEDETLAHELLHLLLEACGVPPVHHPEQVVEFAAPMVELPRRPLRQHIENLGLDAWRLLRAYPEIRPSRLYARAALAVDGVAVFHRGRRRQVVAADGLVVADLLPHEHRLIAAVRSTGRPCCDGRAGAWPFSDGGEDPGGIVVLARPEDACAEVYGGVREW
jgi:hypothetical protein